MRLKGIYALIFRLNEDANIVIGALGNIAFKKGTYVYVGSAQNNLEQRVKRHLRKEKHKFWHIDYLLDHSATIVIETLYRQGSKTEECVVVALIAQRGEAVKGFGCSDCHCVSHLFRIVDTRFLSEIMQVLNLE